jgi:predicted MFS family arabinose efflux permease
MVGATAAGLEHTFGIGTIEIGLLATITSAVGAVATIPAGMLVDSGRNRAHLLAFGLVAWSVAIAFGGAAVSYPMLIASRVGLGALSSVAGPAVSSLSGSFFAVGGRGRAYGFILAGELAGAGVGLVAGGVVSSLTSWRGAWFLLGLMGAVLAVGVWRYLPEPGPAEQERRKEEQPGSAEEKRLAGDLDGHEEALPEATPEDERVPELPRPHRSRVLEEDPRPKPIWWAVRYVLSIRTNVMLIVASSLGYLFFSALRTFAYLLLRSRYRLDTLHVVAVVTIVGVVAAVGVVLGGRFGDRLVARGVVSARLLLAGGGFLVTAVLFSAGLLTDSIAIALPLFAIALAGLGIANPSLDASRLDVVPSGLRGRAESVRTVLRSGAEAAAPVGFGLVAAEFGARSLSKSSPTTSTTGSALATTFIISEGLLLIAGVVLLIAGRRTYPRDFATAVASEANLSNRKKHVGGEQRRSRRRPAAG